MMSITSRQLRDEDDYQAVRSLLQRIQAVDGPPEYCTVGNLDWWRFTEEDPAAIQQARVWFDGSGAAIGFAWSSDGRVDHFSHPNHHDLEP